MTHPVVLASGSPRRKVLLGLLLDGFHVEVPDVDETFPEKDVAQAMEEVAARKAAAVGRPKDGVVLAADTAVLLDGRVLGKPLDLDDARRMLEALCGRDHQVVTAVAVDGQYGCSRFHVTTQVTMDLPDDVLEAYLDGGHWEGKAGAYGAQDDLLRDHLHMDGPWSNVVGLPLHAVKRALVDQGIGCHHPPSEDALRVQNPF